MNNKNAFICKGSNGRFGFKVALEILQHDQYTAIAGGKFVRFDFLVCRPYRRLGSCNKNDT